MYEEYVAKYVTHLNNLKIIKDKRSVQKQTFRSARMSKGVDEYNWTELVENRQLGSLYVKELDKYLDKFKLKKNGNKTEKIKAIMFHVAKCNEVVARAVFETPEPAEPQGEDLSKSESSNEEFEDDSDDNDIVLAVQEESGSDTADEIYDRPEVVKSVTRSGRTVGRFRLN